jgi:hypothetical protein
VSKAKSFLSISLIGVFGLTIIFHLFILFQIIPYSIVWGGRLKTESDMYGFETVSILLNLIFIAIVCVKAGYLKIGNSMHAINIALWAMGLIFLINTAGNIFSVNTMERLIFTPVTLILAIFCLIFARTGRSIEKD